MLFTKKYKSRLANTEKMLEETKKELANIKQSVKQGFERLNEIVSKKYIHEDDKEEKKDQYNVAKIVDEWLNGENEEGVD